MRVPLHIVERRREKLRDLIRTDGFLPVAAICRQLDISEATARQATAVLHGIVVGDYDELDPPEIAQRTSAAVALARLYFSQERFGLADVDRLAGSPRASQNVRELAALTPDTLIDLQARMTADYPGKKRPS